MAERPIRVGLLTALLACILGSAFGTVATLFLSRSDDGVAAGAPGLVSPTTLSPRDPLGPGGARPIRRPPAHVNPSPASDAQSPSLDDGSDVEDDWFAKLQQHLSEAKSERLSPQRAAISRTLQQDSERLKYVVEDVDCRATMCVAHLVWATFGDAATSYASLLALTPHPDCGVEIVLVPPPEQDAEFRSEVVYLCGGSNGGSNR